MSIIRYILLICGCWFATSVVAQTSPPVTQQDLQRVAQTLQQDLAKVASSIGPQLQKQQDLNQQHIGQVQKQLEGDIIKLQQQIQQMQTHNVQQLQMLQKQIDELRQAKSRK